MILLSSKINISFCTDLFFVDHLIYCMYLLPLSKHLGADILQQLPLNIYPLTSIQVNCVNHISTFQRFHTFFHFNIG